MLQMYSFCMYLWHPFGSKFSVFKQDIVTINHIMISSPVAHTGVIIWQVEGRGSGSKGVAYHTGSPTQVEGFVLGWWVCINCYRLIPTPPTFHLPNNTACGGAVRSAASSYAAMRMVAGSRPVLVIAKEWHIGLALLCSCSRALEYPTTNSFGPINESLSLSISCPGHTNHYLTPCFILHCY